MSGTVLGTRSTAEQYETELRNWWGRGTNGQAITVPGDKL